MKTHYLYWIHHPEHTDITKEGYIGVICQKPLDRLKGHYKTLSVWVNKGKPKETSTVLLNAFNKYGKDCLVQTVLCEGSKDYIYDLEYKLRSSKRIGWNLSKGGICGMSENTHTDEKLVCMLRDYSDSSKSLDHLAEKYSISKSRISTIANGNYRSEVLVKYKNKYGESPYRARDYEENKNVREAQKNKVKLTSEQASMIKELASTGFYSNLLISKMFSVGETLVRSLVKGETLSYQNVEKFLIDTKTDSSKSSSVIDYVRSNSNPKYTDIEKIFKMNAHEVTQHLLTTTSVVKSLPATRTSKGSISKDTAYKVYQMFDEGIKRGTIAKTLNISPDQILRITKNQYKYLENYYFDYFSTDI